MNYNTECFHFRVAFEEGGKMVFLIVTNTPKNGHPWSSWTVMTISEAEFNSSELDFLPEDRVEIVKKMLSHGRGSGEDTISEYVKI